MLKASISQIQEKLKAGEWIGVLPTDTIYGLVGSAFSKEAVERIYRLKKRNKKKPFIVLIASLRDLDQFGIKLSRETNTALKHIFQSKVSIILPVSNKRFSYLHRGKNSIAFRLPSNRWVRDFVRKTGPLVAPSANLEGQPFAKTIREAKAYFGEKVDFYFSKGVLNGKPSVILELKRG